MKLIVGLGNPGLRYKQTRHNVGFMVVDALASEWNIHFKKKNALKSKIASTIVNGEKVLLAKPLTYMNLSGEAVLKLFDYFDVEQADLLVVVDDYDLKFGQIRLRSKGGAGGHNGLSSMIELLKTNEFSRLRIGIKNDFEIDDLADYVLSSFSKKEEKELKTVLTLCKEASLCWLEEGIQKAMNLFNKKKEEVN